MTHHTVVATALRENDPYESGKIRVHTSSGWKHHLIHFTGKCMCEIWRHSSHNSATCDTACDDSRVPCNLPWAPLFCGLRRYWGSYNIMLVRHEKGQWNIIAFILNCSLLFVCFRAGTYTWILNVKFNKFYHICFVPTPKISFKCVI